MKALRHRLGRYLPDGLVKMLRRLCLPVRRALVRRIPTAMITGTKGKTTTTRMLAHILSAAGHRVGLCSTDGVVIDGVYRRRFDASGYLGAREVFGDRGVTAAVLETARGGLLRSGLYVDRCDAAALLNVGREQIGMEGIETIEEMAAVKRRVTDTAESAVVLNADDAECRKLLPRYRERRVILFSLEPDSPFVADHLRAGGSAFVLNGSRDDGVIERVEGESRQVLLSVAELPACAKGLFRQNIANAMAAAALADGMGVPLETVRAALSSFESSLEQSPGRLNLIDGYAPTVLLDGAEHVPSALALVDSLKRIEVPGRRLCMLTTAGNRPDWQYSELAEILAPHFDRFVCYEIEAFRRGRAPGEIAALLEAGLLRAGISPDRIDTALDAAAATERLAQLADKGDLAVLLVSRPHEFLPVFREHFARHRLDRGG